MKIPSSGCQTRTQSPLSVNKQATWKWNMEVEHGSLMKASGL